MRISGTRTRSSSAAKATKPTSRLMSTGCDVSSAVHVPWVRVPTFATAICSPTRTTPPTASLSRRPTPGPSAGMGGTGSLPARSLTKAIV